MSKLSNHRLFPLLGAILLAWLIIVPVLKYLSTQKSFQLSNSEIQHDSGCAYVLDITHYPFGWPIVDYFGDSSEDAQGSKLILQENGRNIGQPHVLHDKIRANGMGNYSHWKKSLFFSASDCSDPRINGRSYEVLMQPILKNWAYALWLIAIMVLSKVVGTYLSVKPYAIQVHGYINTAINALVLPCNISRIPVLGSIIFFILLLSGLGLLAWDWNVGRSVSLAVGGRYQISDSMMYWLCSNSLLDFGSFGHPLTTGEWCQRRAIYPTFLSGIVWLAQRNIFAVLLAQAVIVSLAIYMVIRRGSNYFGLIGALLCAVLLFKYAMVDLFTLTMTENAGLIFGCVGLACLLIASERQSWIWMMSGIAILSIALNARAGAFFVLPSLVLWAGITSYLFKKNIFKWISLSLIAMLAGFVLQALLVIAVNGSPSSSHGNFSYTLYGLSVGGLGWQQVLIDHPELSGSDALMSKTIYAFAWNNFVVHPQLFLNGLLKNISIFITSGTYGFEKLGVWSELIKVCWWLAWIPLIINWRNPSYLLIALSSLGIVLSAPLLIGDGGARVFAASVAVDAMQIAIGFSWASIVLTKGVKQSQISVPILSTTKFLESPFSKISLETGFLIFLFLLLLIPHTPLRWIQASKRISNTQCVNNEYMVLTRIGSGGSMLLDFIADDQKANFLKGQIRYAEFIEGIPSSAWWRDEALAFHGKSLLLAFQQDRSDTYAPGPYPVYSDQHLAEFDGRTVRLCIDRQEKQQVFGIPYRKLNSIKILD